jgi:anti-anti-sigma factor
LAAFNAADGIEMHISSEIVGGVLELRMQGRLDNEAADDLLAAVDDVLRKGHHAALLDMRGVDYVSSAGLGALVRAQKRFQAIHGIFGVSDSSSQVTEILQLTRLAKVLVCDPEEVREKYAGGDGTVQPSFRIAAADGLGLAIYDLQPAEMLCYRTWGEAGRLVTGRCGSRQELQVRFPSNAFGLGIGAFGRDDADCAERFGEFVAVAGGVAVQPTPEGGKPDYQLSRSGFVPQPRVLYGISFSGAFSQIIRFESQSVERPTGLSTLVQRCLEQSGVELAGIVIIAEAAGLIGARLRRSPLSSRGDSPVSFTHPDIRKWFSFTSEHVFPHSLVVVVGVAARGATRGDAATLAPLLRQLNPELDLQGHFHAAVFSYQPLKKRRLNLQETVLSLFEAEELQAVLHLLHDDRAISGSGESQLVAGACWIGPIVQTETEGRTK